MQHSRYCCNLVIIIDPLYKLERTGNSENKNKLDDLNQTSLSNFPCHPFPYLVSVALHAQNTGQSHVHACKNMR